MRAFQKINDTTEKLHEKTIQTISGRRAGGDAACANQPGKYGDGVCKNGGKNAGRGREEGDLHREL